MNIKSAFAFIWSCLALRSLSALFNNDSDKIISNAGIKYLSNKNNNIKCE